MRMGELIPIFCQDVVPGDTFKLNTELLIRFAPLIAPVMHRMNVYTHFFFVPKRLLWDNWKTFITGGESGEEVPSYPRIRFNSNRDIDQYFNTGSLFDYLGFPVKDNVSGTDGDFRFLGTGTYSFDIDALPVRAYNLIWNEYYRDQNLSDEVDIMKDIDGIVTIGSGQTGQLVKFLLNLRQRCWTKDYFTSALPFTQRGGEVSLPLYGDASASVDNPLIVTTDTRNYGAAVYTDSDGIEKPYVGSITYGSDLLPHGTVNGKDVVVQLASGVVDNQQISSKLNVDLSNVSAATINELRRAIKAQEYLEATARSGSRYIEYIKGIFGVNSSDARLQRPEYLGGGRQPVVISDVMQTSQTTDTSALGTPGGAAASLGKTHSFKKYFEEFGYVIGIMSVLPVPAYQQGMPRQFTKFDRYDHYIPQFAHLGEQEIKSSELYFDPSKPGDDGLFGYAPRYAEYKFINSSVHGDFRTSLKYWHMGRIFSERPGLNSSFVTSNPTDRIFAVEDTDYDKLWVNIHHNCTALRPMPKYGTPMI